ncbi:Uncharacterised protein [Klebsiella pneumoniae]|nr:Uncharacterised protein [Klebsiella pneumoniae]SXL38236.1 Uncharacterised protein [Klebsiella pneumoniae]
MGVVRIAIGFITAASIRTCISFHNRRNAVTGSPFPGENAAVDRVSSEPQLCKLDTLAELMPFPFGEDFFIGTGEFPERRHIVFFDFRDILGGQNQILDGCVISVHFKN